LFLGKLGETVVVHGNAPHNGPRYFVSHLVGNRAGLPLHESANAEDPIRTFWMAFPRPQSRWLGRLSPSSIHDWPRWLLPTEANERRQFTSRLADAVQAIFCRRRHQPRSPPLTKIRPGSPAPATGDEPSPRARARAPTERVPKSPGGPWLGVWEVRPS
jgi:hypothetical protein